MNRSLKTALRVAGITLALGAAGATGYVFAIPATAPEYVPRSFTYAGYLENDQGQPLPDGNVVLTFELFDSPTVGQGTSLWSSGGLSVRVDDGHFTVELGDLANPMDPTDLARAGVYLQVTLTPTTGSPLVLGRQQLGSVPYALRAARAAEAEGAAGSLATKLAGQNRVSVEYGDVSNPSIVPGHNVLRYSTPLGSNPGGGYDTTTGGYTVPFDGCYQVTASYLGYPNSDVLSDTFIAIYINGPGSIYRILGRRSQQGDAAYLWSGSTTVCLTAGQVLLIGIYSAAVNVSYTTADPVGNRLSIVRISE